MAIFDNSPGDSYIRITGAIVNYHENLYNVMDFYTCKKYVYWDSNNPYSFKDDNVVQSTSQTLKLIAINDFGVHTVYPSETDNFSISFDGDSKKNTEKRINGLYEKDAINGERFVAIETDVTGIKNTVGSTTELKGTLVENITQLHQKDNEIKLSVTKNTKELKDNKLRDDVNATIIKLSSDAGLFQSKISAYFKDDRISQIEKDEILVHYKALDTSRDKMYIELDKVIAMLVGNEDTTGKLALESAKTAFDNAHKNLQTVITNAISDNVITPSDKTLVLNAFAQYNLLKNQLKNTVDDLIILGMGGTISEEISSIRMQSNEISLSVQESEKNMKAELSIMSDRISSKVSAGEVYSIIEQSPEAVKYAFNGISASVVIDKTGLAVSQGRIKTEAIEPGVDGRIVLEPGYTYGNGQDRNKIRSIDCVNDQIRLKYDEDSYIAVGNSAINFYVNSGHSPVLSIGSGGLTGYAKYERTTGTYYRVGDHLNTGGFYCQYPTNENGGLRIKSGDSDSYAAVGINATDAWFNQGSDIRLKENIHYLKESKSDNTKSSLDMFKIGKRNITSSTNEGETILSYNKETYQNKDITKEDLYNFIKYDLKLCEYNYKESSESSLNFIAQDIYNTKVGKLFIDKNKDGLLSYRLGQNYISIIIGALQYEIIKREQLEERLLLLESRGGA